MGITSKRPRAGSQYRCLHTSLAALLILDATSPSVGKAVGQDAAAASKTSADFLVGVVGEHFVIRLTKPELIEIARARIKGTKPQGIVSGRLIESDGGFNAGNGGKNWSWHLDPDSVQFPQLTTEVCDGKPSDVESNKDHWINSVKMFCPWNAKIEREVSSQTAASDWEYHQDFTKGAGWDADIDGCKVRWCDGKDWDGKAGCDANGALRLIKKGNETVVFVDFGEQKFTQASIKLKYFHIQLDGDVENSADSKLQYRQGKDDAPSCATTKGIYKTVRELSTTSPATGKPVCAEEEATVDLDSGSHVVYWKFLKGGYPRAIIIDDITLRLSSTATTK